MFTGLIQHVGRIARLDPGSAGATLILDAAGWGHHPSPGDSIAVNGCCLTVVETVDRALLRFDIVHQTLTVTTLGTLKPGDLVNMEHAATPTTLLGGHIVQGHVDSVGRARRVDERPAEVRIRVDVEEQFMDAIVPRGSVAVDGVSLTVADVAAASFDVCLIPTTLKETNLCRIDSEPVTVNLEADYLVKAVLHHIGRRDRA